MRHRPGFTLLEVLVAGSIAAMMMAVLLSVMRDSALSMQAASGTEMALAVARNHLTLLTADVSHAKPEMHGSDGDYQWQTHVSPIATAAPAPGVVAAFLARNNARPVLFAVTVEVSWRVAGKARHIHLTTHRLGYTSPSGEHE